jgi:pimeloyl-ACP methyl ester carboxylesterase
MITPLQCAQVIASGYADAQSPVLPEGWALLDRVMMNPHLGPWGSEIVTGYLIGCGDEKALIFLGTQDAAEWVNNFDSHAISVVFNDGLSCFIEHGFFRMWCRCRLERAYRNLREYLWDKQCNVTIAGHSLGGALACLAARTANASHWYPRLITFGCPRVGDVSFAAKTGAYMDGNSAHWRNVHDLIPGLPPWLEPMHGPEITFDSDALGIPADVVSRHKMPCYIVGVESKS